MLKYLKRNYLLICIILFISALFLRILIANYKYTEFISSALLIISEFLLSLSFTLFISIFILTKIQEENKRVFENKLIDIQNEINKDIITGVFKKFVHQEVFDVIKNSIIFNRIVRKNALWIFVFKEENSKIHLIKEISYDIENNSKEAEIEELRYDCFDFRYYKTKVIDIMFNGSEQKFEEITELNKKIIKTDLRFEPNSVNTLKYKIQNTYNHDEIFGTFSARYPIIGLNCIIDYPNGYELILSDSFSQKPEISKNEKLNKMVIRLKSAILQGQGINFFLVKSDNN